MIVFDHASLFPSLEAVRYVSVDRHAGRLLRNVPRDREALDDLDRIVNGKPDQRQDTITANTIGVSRLPLYCSSR